MTRTTSALSAAKAALLAQYLRGEVPQGLTEQQSIPRRPQEERIPLSFGQQQMWLHAQMAPDRPVYNECVTLRLTGPLDVATLERAFREVIRRHEAWRTTFAIMDGEPVQVVHPPPSITLPVTDLTEIVAVAREAEALRLATEDARVPMDLARGPLLRTRLIKMAPDEHRLYLTLPHILSDGVSIYNVFRPELAALYEAFSAGKPSPLPEPAIQYADYAYWQRRSVANESLTEQMTYWRRQLGGDLPVLELATDHPRPAVQTFRGSTQFFTLSPELTDALKELSRRAGVTLYMTLLGAFATLLHRYTSQDDIVIGTATGIRDQPEIEHLMGYFLNTLALRTDLAGNPAFAEFLKRIRRTVLDAQAHKDVPFELVVGDVHPQRNLARNPLFQVMFALQPPLAPINAPWSISQLDIAIGAAKFDLSVELDVRPEGIAGCFEYSTDLFEAATITRMMEHFHVLLRGIVADPDCPLSDLPLLTETERHQVLVEWNATKTEFLSDRLIHERFEEQVARAPDAIAMAFKGETLTYAELNAKANQLAHYLHKHGAGPDVLIGLCVERSLEMVIGILGILKAGSAYVPLDPTYPKERLRFIIADTRMPIMLTQARLTGALPQYDGSLICLDRDWPAIAQADDANPASGAQPDNLAYIIYTSGSTGKPKGVMVSHANVVRLFDATDAWFHFDCHDTWTLFHSFAFDFSVWELWGALLFGGRLIVVPFLVNRSPEAFLNLLRAERVTVLNQTPSAFYQLIATEEKTDVTQPLALRVVIFGGEALDPQRLRPWFARHGDQSPQLINMYGITETTVHVTYYPLTAADSDAGSRSPIGRAIPDLRLYILDPHGQPVPLGVPGELYVGGAGVTRGYLNRSDLTAERFLPDPFSLIPGARLYKTGDLARYQPDGTIEYLGRLDQQVKIRGFRIELGEIEAALMRHPDVQEALALVRDERPGESRLIAYVVPRQGKSPGSNDLRRVLALQVPEYMIPSAFVRIDAMPLTPNGKVDRGALPAPSSMQSQRATSFVPPQGLLQLQLAQIWEEILDVWPIGITDDFFELGGHSLLAARLVDRIAEVCGQTLPLATLFSGATIEHLEKALLQRVGESPSSPVALVREGNNKRPFFFLHGDLEDGGIYCVKLARALDPDRPFYALHPSGVDGRPVPHTIEAIAAEHLDALRAVQPEGPYLLGGYCNGAVFAFEMARQLQAEGQHVEAVILIQPGRARPSVRGAGMLIGLWGKLARLDAEEQIRLFLSLRARYIDKSRRFLSPGRIKVISAFDSLLRKRLEALARMLLPGDRHILLPSLLPEDHAGDARSHAAFEVQYRYAWAGNRYVPQRYHGRVAMYQASDEQKEERSDATLGWKELIDDIDVYVTPGSHFSSITTHVEALAAQMGMWLRTVEEAAIKQSMVDGG